MLKHQPNSTSMQQAVWHRSAANWLGLKPNDAEDHHAARRLHDPLHPSQSPPPTGGDFSVVVCASSCAWILCWKSGCCACLRTCFSHFEQNFRYLRNDMTLMQHASRQKARRQLGAPGTGALHSLHAAHWRFCERLKQTTGQDAYSCMAARLSSTGECSEPCTVSCKCDSHINFSDGGRLYSKRIRPQTLVSRTRSGGWPSLRAAQSF